MKLSLHATAILGLIFCVIALGVAINGFMSLRELADPAQLADAKGYAWFWTFIAAVCGSLAWLAWWTARKQGNVDEHSGG